jgi:hypothetical protein
MFPLLPTANDYALKRAQSTIVVSVYAGEDRLDLQEDVAISYFASI